MIRRLVLTSALAVSFAFGLTAWGTGTAARIAPRPATTGGVRGGPLAADRHSGAKLPPNGGRSLGTTPAARSGAAAGQGVLPTGSAPPQPGVLQHRWRRTRLGWIQMPILERVETSPAHAIHPLTIALLQLMLSVAALVAASAPPHAANGSHLRVVTAPSGRRLRIVAE